MQLVISLRIHIVYVCFPAHVTSQIHSYLFAISLRIREYNGAQLSTISYTEIYFVIIQRHPNVYVGVFLSAISLIFSSDFISDSKSLIYIEINNLSTSIPSGTQSITTPILNFILSMKTID